MKVKDIPISERPREKLLKYNASNLSDAELIATIIKTGTKNKNVIDLSYEIIDYFGSISALKNSTLNDLLKIKGIGKAKAVEILAMIEISKRMHYTNNDNKIKYNNPENIYKNVKYLFDNLFQEHFYCFYLDNKKNLIDKKLLFIGTLNKSLVHPREIFKQAYKLSASAIICVHNHPSGDTFPSDEDINLTSNLINIGKLNAIPVIDHLIISPTGYFSFFEKGLIK